MSWFDSQAVSSENLLDKLQGSQDKDPFFSVHVTAAACPSHSLLTEHLPEMKVGAMHIESEYHTLCMHET
jgi:hypothetical protein